MATLLHNNQSGQQTKHLEERDFECRSGQRVASYCQCTDFKQSMGQSFYLQEVNVIKQ